MEVELVSGNRSSGSGTIGKVLTTLFFLVFLGFGLVFIGVILRTVYQDVLTRTWARTPCTILSSEVELCEEEDYCARPTYSYQFKGTTFRSDHYSLHYSGSKDYTKAARIVLAYNKGTDAICYVNPVIPSESVLAHESILTIFAAFIPLIFVVVGAGGIYSTWKPDHQSIIVVPVKKALSQKADNSGSKWILTIFFGIIAVVGFSVFTAFFGIPILKIIVAQDWPSVPCTVERSKLRVNSDSDGDTYRVNILYRYTVEGQTYKSNRYKFVGGSSSGSSSKREILAHHPVGSRTICYFNPKDPLEAVLNRGFSTELLFGLIPLVFLIVGAGGLYFTHFSAASRRRGIYKAGEAGSWRPGEHVLSTPGLPEYPRERTPLELSPTGSRLKKLIGVLFAAIFWNGILSVFLTIAIGSWLNGNPAYFLSIFLIPFVLVGFFLIGGVLYQFIILFNPVIRLSVRPRAVRLGDTLQVDYRVSGLSSMISLLTIIIEGREETDYTSSSDTCTDKETFSEHTLVSVERGGIGIKQGRVTWQSPSSAMHTFRGENNRVLWHIKVSGHIRFWPDINDEYEIAVLPANPASRGYS